MTAPDHIGAATVERIARGRARTLMSHVDALPLSRNPLTRVDMLHRASRPTRKSKARLTGALLQIPDVVEANAGRHATLAAFVNVQEATRTNDGELQKVRVLQCYCVCADTHQTQVLAVVNLTEHALVRVFQRLLTDASLPVDVVLRVLGNTALWIAYTFRQQPDQWPHQIFWPTFDDGEMAGALAIERIANVADKDGPAEFLARSAFPIEWLAEDEVAFAKALFSGEWQPGDHVPARCQRKYTTDDRRASAVLRHKAEALTQEQEAADRS